MGQPKALLCVGPGREPLVVAHVRALAACCDRVCVVVGAEAARVAELAAAAGAEVRHNPAWASTGPRESLLCGVDGRADSDTVVITPVDAEPAPAAALAALTAVTPPAVLRAEGRDGHPVYAEVGALRVGLARGPLDQALQGALRVDTDWRGATVNLNTPDELAAWRAAQAPRPAR